MAFPRLTYFSGLQTLIATIFCPFIVNVPISQISDQEMNIAEGQMVLTVMPLWLMTSPGLLSSNFSKQATETMPKNIILAAPIDFISIVSIRFRIGFLNVLKR
jgi:hypothetical protein